MFQTVIAVLIVVVAFYALVMRLAPIKVKRWLLLGMAKMTRSSALAQKAGNLTASGCGVCEGGACCSVKKNAPTQPLVHLKADKPASKT